MTLAECFGLLAIAGRVYNRANDPALAEDWYHAMADVPIDTAIAAMRAHVRETKWFPTIAEILARVEAMKPAVLYLPKRVADAVPEEEIRQVLERVTRKLRGAE